MSRRGALDTIVVGGGAIGAALALALARDGFAVALVEARAPKLWRIEDDVDLRVVALAADARALLDDLGAWPAIESARAGPYRRMRVFDALAPGELRFDAADRGEASLGIVYETDAKIEPNVKIVGHFPDGSYPPIVYPVAATATAKDGVADYLSFLKSSAAKATFEKYGFSYLIKPTS